MSRERMLIEGAHAKIHLDLHDRFSRSSLVFRICPAGLVQPTMTSFGSRERALKVDRQLSRKIIPSRVATTASDGPQSAPKALAGGRDLRRRELIQKAIRSEQS